MSVKLVTLSSRSEYQYISKVREPDSFPAHQISLVIINVFTGQMTTTVLDLYKESNTEVVSVPANHCVKNCPYSESFWSAFSRILT